MYLIIMMTRIIDHLQIKSMAKIAPTTAASVVGFIPSQNSRSRSRGPLKKDKIQLSHLPPEIHQTFRTVFTPRLREKFGNSPPWESPSEDDICKLWSQIFNNALKDGEMEFVVFKLVSPTHSRSESHNINSLNYR